jgi:hypothetical protein
MPLRSRSTKLFGAPTREGWRPRFWWMGLLAVGAACTSGNANQVTAPADLGMTSKMQPYYSDGNLTLYEAQKPVTLPVRKPSASELKALGSAPTGTPYPRAPFLTADDESVEVHFTITNADSTQHAVWLLIDPWNEFVRWVPGVTVVDADVTVPNQGYDQAFPVPANSRIEGTLTADDIHEIATKLAAVQAVMHYPTAMSGMVPQAPSGMAQAATALSTTTLCNNIFDYQNRSNSTPPDSLYTAWIPPVVAGLTGFDLGIRTYDGAANIAIEVTIDVVDLNGNRFVQQDDTSTPKLGLPQKTLSPPMAKF